MHWRKSLLRAPWYPVSRLTIIQGGSSEGSMGSFLFSPQNAPGMACKNARSFRRSAEPIHVLLFPILLLLVIVFIFRQIYRSARGPSGALARSRGRTIFVPYGGRAWGGGTSWAADLHGVALGGGFGRGRLVGWRRRIGELVMPLTEHDRTAIAAAIREAESEPAARSARVLARSSSDYSAVPIEWAAALALIAPWPLIYFTQLSVQRIFSLQIAVFISAATTSSWSPLRMAIVPRAVLGAGAIGPSSSSSYGASPTPASSCGVLIFASMAEHYARIVADEGVSLESRAVGVASRR